MVALTPKELRIVQLIGSLPTDRRRMVLTELARQTDESWIRNREQGNEELRRVAKSRGVNWDQLSDDEKQDMVCDLLDEAA